MKEFRCNRGSCYGKSFPTQRELDGHQNAYHKRPHTIEPVYMASGYQWCNNCGMNIRKWGEGWRHSPGYYPRYED